MRQLLIHIGTNKTGTTSIQQTLYYSNQYLLSKGILYDTSLHPNNHYIAPVFNAMQFSKYISLGMIEGCVEDMEKRLIASFSRSDFDRYLISSEFLLNKSDDELQRLKSLVSQYFDDIKIIVYVREPVAYCLSQIQQRMKAIKRETRGLFEEINQFKDENKYRYIGRWADTFGRQNMIVRRFDKKYLINGDVVEDFFSLIDGKEINYDRLSVRHTNFSLGKNSVLFLEQLNKKYATFINGEINQQKGLALKGLAMQIFRKIEDEKFILDIKFNHLEAERMNEELRVINTYLNKEERFDEVKASDTETEIPGIEEVPTTYYIELFNQYNLFLGEKLDELDLMISRNKAMLQQINDLKKGMR